MRPSKLIMTFGPGSIVDFPNRESYIVMGPDYWQSHEIIREHRLARKLGCDHFGSPQKRWDMESDSFVGIAVRDFPFIRVCPYCGKLSYDFLCEDCKRPEDKKGPKTMPPRLVAACKGGHIQDFPWRAWCGCKCNKPTDARLFLIGENIEAEGSDLKVVCKNCKKERNLMGALGELRYDCNGQRPWLGDKETCSRKLYGLMRGASNVYFPILESSLSIPPYSKEIHKDIEKHMSAARANWANKNIKGYIENNDELKKYIKDGRYTEDELTRAFDEIFGAPSSTTIKGEEWDRLIHDVKYGPNDEFQTRKVNIIGSDLDKWFDRVVLVTKLREVVTVTGFNRVEPNPHPDTVQKLRMENWSDFLDNHPSISPSLDIDTPRNWLPGVELFGEGVFFKFKESLVDRWINEPANYERCKEIISQPKQPFEKEGVDIKDERTILVHTFAHQFIRQISLECGYSMASLRERLYVKRTDERDMCGVLIYTASSDSEGTLGGLVAQAKDCKTLLNHILNIIESVKVCSQDPLCGAHESKVTKNAWGASCHSCSQLPETSCEGLQNKLLDRFSLIRNTEVTGYFDVK